MGNESKAGAVSAEVTGAEKNIAATGGAGSAAAEGTGAAGGTVASGDLDATRAELDRASGHAASLQGKIATIGPVLGELGVTVDESADAPSLVDQIIDAARALAAERDTLKAKAERAAKAPKAASKPRTAKVRSVAVPKAPLDQDERKALRERLASGDETFELVATNGKTELPGLDPVVIGGDAFQPNGDRMKLIVPIDYCPGAKVTIEGFALFDEDNKQVAYMPLPEPQPIDSGASMRFVDAIVF